MSTAQDRLDRRRIGKVFSAKTNQGTFVGTVASITRQGGRTQIYAANAPTFLSSGVSLDRVRFL